MGEPLPQGPHQAVSRIRVLKAGRLGYAEGLALQQRLAAGRDAGAEPDTLILLEHDPVITLGRGAHAENVLLSEQQLAEQGVSLFPTDRGGDVTYHGPGQVVAYPIFDLKPDRMDVRRFVASLEEVMIRTCADHGVTAGRHEGKIGCWLGGEVSEGPWRKIGAIGVHLSRWITTHGLAFNVKPEMDHFRLIVPCGIAEYGVTSLATELGEGACPTVAATMDRIAGHFAEVFGAAVTG